MLTAAAIALAMLASTPDAAAPVNRSLPPIVVAIGADAPVTASIVRLVEAEVDAIFRSAGVRFQWRDRAASAASLVVSIDHESGPDRDGYTPLGWLVFENGLPTSRIHISYPNAERFMANAREVVGVVSTKTIAEREALIGRLMGRALAHELGHYLLETKEHRAKGLLKGSPTAQEFFSPLRNAFAIDSIERTELAARLRKPLDLARVIP
jgi:hypothetical protein